MPIDIVPQSHNTFHCLLKILGQVASQALPKLLEDRNLFVLCNRQRWFPCPARGISGAFSH